MQARANDVFATFSPGLMAGSSDSCLFQTAFFFYYDSWKLNS